MWMEQQGKKATHDFLSLHSKDPSSVQIHDPRPPNNNKGFLPRTYDFLQPLEREAGGGERPPPPEKLRPAAVAGAAHVLPGGIGTYSISHVSEPVVKTERGTCGDSAAGGYSERVAGAAFALSDRAGGADAGLSSTDARTRAPWPSPPIAAGRTTVASLSSSRSPPPCSPPPRVSNSLPSRSIPIVSDPQSCDLWTRPHPPQPRKRSMERSSGFDDDDDDEEYGGGKNSSTHRGELNVKVYGKNGGAVDQRPSTPRSKHSATEQRRRSKINDRFQILRELIPHSDQKRDKASFLLEVIEYIRFLQEKVHKYESPSYPGWTEEDAKLLPWVKVYFRSFWKNARNSQGPGDGIADPSQIMKNGSVPPGFIFSGDDNNAPVPPAMISASLNPSEPDYKAAENPSAFASKVTAASISEPNLYGSIGRGSAVAQSQQLISDPDNTTTQSHPQWLRSPSPTDCTVTGDTLSEQEELAIDEGTISVSSAYSQRLLVTLSQTLQTSGIDLSQASISVNINLGKRATNRRPTVLTTMSSAKDHDNPSSGNRAVGHSTVGSSGEESEQACKRHRLDNS